MLASSSSLAGTAAGDDHEEGAYEFPPIMRRPSLLSLSSGVSSLKRSGTSLRSRRESAASVDDGVHRSDGMESAL